VETEEGTAAFLKWSGEGVFTGFGVEARGLLALAERGGVRVPRVLGFGSGESGAAGWLLLEFVRPGAPGSAISERLGEGLATLHRPLSKGAPGWEEDGWIGRLPQRNGPGQEWPAFWRDARLLPLLSRLEHGFDRKTRAGAEQVLSDIHLALEGWQDDGLSLLHGDLWSGNVLWDESGDPVLLDPAAYRGHREVDLAMMELFGGFSGLSFDAYFASAPLAPGYPERRRDAYQLYPLLVHLGMFGEGYLPRVRHCILRLASAIS
jgi:fructosamine-3-kinase